MGSDNLDHNIILTQKYRTFKSDTVLGSDQRSDCKALKNWLYRWFAQSMIRASARNVHSIARMIFYIARIIRSQRDNCLPLNS